MQVTFIDFGNKEKVPGNRVRTIEPALAALPPQAQLLSLAYLKVRLENFVLFLVLEFWLWSLKRRRSSCRSRTSKCGSSCHLAHKVAVSTAMLWKPC